MVSAIKGVDCIWKSTVRLDGRHFWDDQDDYMETKLMFSNNTPEQTSILVALGNQVLKKKNP